jgi:hypothetical protein
MLRLIASALLIGLLSTAASAQSARTHRPGHLFMFNTEHNARLRCPGGPIVWVNTATHTMHAPGDPHYAHTHGGFACEAEARAHGYHPPRAHA